MQGLEKEDFTSVSTLTGLRQDIHIGYCCACLWLCIAYIFSVNVIDYYAETTLDKLKTITIEIVAEFLLSAIDS